MVPTTVNPDYHRKAHKLVQGFKLGFHG